MILILKISNSDFSNYTNEFNECLKYNLAIFERIFIFSDFHLKEFSGHPKIKIFKSRTIQPIFNCINIAKSNAISNNIFILANPFVKFKDLSGLNNISKLECYYKPDCFYVFHKDLALNQSNNLDLIFSNLISVSVNIERLKYWPNTESTGSGEKNQVIRRKSIPSNKSVVLNPQRDKKLDVIIVSVNYNDFLLTSLSYNSKIFENITVVTSSDDLMCQKICEKLQINCLITDIMYDDDSKFNKGKAINYGISQIENKDLILLLDADIIVTEKINLNQLDDESLYTSGRWICETHNRFQNWEKTGDTLDLNRWENDRGFGFFQLFNSNNRILNDNFYPENYKDAAMSDLVFRDKFTSRKSIENKVIHLGESYTNWSGRKTSRFIDDETFYKFFEKIRPVKKEQNTNEWGVSQIEIETSKYGKFKINNQVQFSYHQGGWGEVLKSLKKINSENGIRFECFLEKNFCWNGSKDEIISEKWSGILHNPLNAPEWYLNKTSNKNIFESKNFIKSLENCIGLFVLSDYENKILKRKLRLNNIKIQVETLRHPSIKCEKKWSFNSYKFDKKIIHIGWWLRDVESFYSFQTKLTKIRIKLNDKIESQLSKIFNLNDQSVIEIESLDSVDYDFYLSNSVVYLNVVDSVINNTVLECIERGTPILINRNKSIEEYIGKDYPLFYDNTSDIDQLVSDENLILANKYLLNITKVRDIGTQIEFSKIYQSIESNLNIKTLFKPKENSFFGDNLLDSEGGIYNPGFINFENKNFIMLRVEKFTEKQRGYKELWKRTSSVPHLVEVDKNFNPIKVSILNVVGDFKRIEDFRLFEFKGKLYSNHILLDDNDNIYPVLSEVDIENSELKILGKIDLGIKLKKVEKNWIFYHLNGKIYLIYSLSNWRIFEIDIDSLTGKEIINKNYDISWSEEGYISNSTNPIRLSENKNILGFHSRDSQLIYHQGLLTFDDDFNLLNYSKEPYLSGGDYDGINKNVIYTSSLKFENDILYCLAGDGDFKTILIEIKDQDIWKKLL